MKKIVVASKNPVKIQAAFEAFTKMFPDETFEVEGISAESGVPDQPSSDEETRTGAYNRALNASNIAPDADYWVGMEGGIEDRGDDMESFAWMVVRGRDGQVGKGRTGILFLAKLIPSKLMARSAF